MDIPYVCDSGQTGPAQTFQNLLWMTMFGNSVAYPGKCTHSVSLSLYAQAAPMSSHSISWFRMGAGIPHGPVQFGIPLSGSSWEEVKLIRGLHAS